MAIQELGGSELLLRFDDDYLGGLHAVQGESGRVFKYILVDPSGSVIDARPYTLTMTIAMKGGINQTSIQGKADGTFEIEVTVDMLARYGKGDVQLMISETETKKTLGTVIGTILIERNIAFDSGEGINLIFEFAELQQKIAFMSVLVEQGAENLNQAMVAKIEACNCADDSKLARDESIKIKDSLKSVFETEQSRVVAEDKREDDEGQRKKNEASRLANEIQRTQDETTRKDNEKERLSSEAERQSQETERQSTETSRQSAEDKRVSSETTRDEQETIRKSNEVKRESNESTRQSQESERVEAEKERKSTWETWDTTMEGIIPNATETSAGVVQVEKVEGEETPHKVPTVGKIEEDMTAFKSGIVEDNQSFKDEIAQGNQVFKDGINQENQAFKSEIEESNKTFKDEINQENNALKESITSTVDNKITEVDNKMSEVDSKINSKIDLSALTFEQEGKTYLAKFTVEDGMPKIIANEVV